MSRRTARADRRSLVVLIARRPLLQLVLVAGLLALFAFTIGFSPASAQTNTIDSCGTTINESGTYEVTGDLTRSGDHCIYIEESDVVIDGQGHTLSGDKGEGMILTNETALSNVTVRDVTVSGGDPSLHVHEASDVRVSNVTVVDGGVSIYVSNSTGVLVENSTVETSGNEPWFDGSSDVTIRDSVVRDSGGNDVILESGDVAVINLTVANTGGIQITAPNGTVRDSTVESPSSGHGIHARADGVLVANNTVTGVPQQAIRVEEAADVVVRDNEIRDSDIGTKLNSAPGLRYLRNTVTTSGKYNPTIGLAGSSNLHIEGNNVSNNLHRAFYNGGSNVTFLHNTIANNDGRGIDISDATQDDVVVRNNTIRDNADDGIDQAGGDANPTVEGNLIAGNGGRGYYLAGGVGARVRDNVIRSNTGRGLVVQGSDAIVAGNRLESNTQGLRIANTNNVSMRENHAENNSGAGFYVTGSDTEISFENSSARGNDWALTADSSLVNVTGFDVGDSTEPNTTFDATLRNVQFTRATGVADPPTGNDSIGRYVDAASTGSDSFLDFDLHYDEGDLGTAYEPSISAFRDGGDATWSPVNASAVDTDANVVSGNATAFGDIGAFAESATPISGCTHVQSPGSYALDGDVRTTEEQCINLDADGAAVHGNGHAVTYNGTDSTETAIYVNAAANGTVRNVSTAGWNKGTYVYGSSEIELVGLNHTDGETWGLEVGDSDNVTVRDSTLRNNGDASVDPSGGAYAVLSRDVTFENVTARNNSMGAYVDRTDRFVARNSAFAGNGQEGLRFAEAKGGTIESAYVDENAGTALSVEAGSTVSATSFDLGASTAANTTLDFDASDVTLDAVSSSPDAPAGKTGIGRYFDATELSTDGYLDAVLHYEDDDVGALNESTLGLSHYNASESAWSTLPDSTVDTSANTLSANATSFSTFGALAEDTTTLTGCQEITASGTYVLNETIEDSASRGECIYVQASDVTIDGNGHALQSSGDTSDNAIQTASGYRNHTFRNVTLDGWDTSLYLDDATNLVVEDVTSTDGSGYGVRVDSGNATLTDVRVRNHSAAALFQSDETAYANATGFDIGPSTAPNTTLDFEARGVVLNRSADPQPVSDDREAIGRYFDATSRGSGNEYLDVSLHYEEGDLGSVGESTLGISRYDSGSTSWVELSDSTVDTSADTISANVTSFSTFGALGQNSSITGCTNVTSSGTYVLEDDVDASQAPCISVEASDVVVDGQGHVLNGSAAPNGTGVLVDGDASGLTNVTVRNLTVRDWNGTGSSGVTALNVTDATLRNVTAVDGAEGINVTRGSEIAVRDASTTHNGEAGLQFEDGARNVSVANLTSTDNGGDGIAFWDSSGNATVSEVDARRNGASGIRIQHTDRRVAIDNATVVDNGEIGLFVFNALGHAIEDSRFDSNAWGTLQTNDGGELTASGVDFGASTRANTTLDFDAHNVGIEAKQDPPATPSDRTGIGRYFHATNSSSSGSYLDVDLHYEDGDLGSVDESTLNLSHYDETAWSALPGSTVDTSANTLSANVTSFGTFGALGQNATNFTVEIVETNSPVLVGERVNVTANVTNTGEATGTQDVNLTVAGGGEVQPVSLNGSESANVTLGWSTEGVEAGNYSATVASENDSDDTNVTVEEPAYFEVGALDANDTVVRGDTLEVAANVTNTGDRNATQLLNLSVAPDGVEVDNASVTIEAGESKTPTFTWDTSGVEAGEYTATVASENASNDTSVTVQAPANFTVAIDDTTSPVVRNETLTVNATIANEGDLSDTQTIELVGNGTVKDDQSVTLDANGTQSIELNWSTEGLDAGNYTATVRSEDDDATENVTVQTPANFSVQVSPADDPVLQGENLTVTAAVTNDGEANGTQTVTLEINESVGDVDHESVTLTGGASTTVDLTWATNDSHAGEYGATVRSEDDADDASVRVEEPAFLDVSIADVNETVVAGEDVVVTANVTNTGDRNATQLLNLSVDPDGAEVDNASVTINASESKTPTFTWNTTGVEGATYDVTVASENDSATENVTVQDPANFSVAIADADATLVEGQPLNVTATVTNVGDVDGKQTVNLTINRTDGQADEATLSLNASESASTTLNWSTAGQNATTYEATVASENDSDAHEFEVLASDAFEVDVTGTNEPVTEGETLTVDANVSYDAADSASQDVTLDVDGLRATENVSFDGPATREIRFEWATESGDAGSYTAIVASENDSDGTSVAVEAADGGGGGILPPPDGNETAFDVTIDGTTGPVHVGEQLTVTANVSNVGGAEATDEVTLSALSAVRDDVTLTLGANESRTVALNWTPTADDVGDHSVTVASSSDSAIRYVTVEPAPTLDVSIEGTNAPVPAGRVLEVTAGLAANGPVNETVELLSPDGDRVDARRVELEANESRTVGLSWPTSASDAGSRVVTVRAENDSASTEVHLQAPAELSVEIVEFTGTVGVNESHVVAVRVSNRGDRATIGRAKLTVAGAERASQRVRLDGGDRETVRLEWTPGPGDAGTHDLRVAAGSGSDSRTLTVEGASDGGLGPYVPEWGDQAVAYEPSQQDTHVGGFLWLSVLVGGLGTYVLVTRRTLDGRLLALTLFTAATRTGTDVLHASVGGVETEQLLALNTVLELYAGLLFLAFGAAYAEYAWLLSRRGVATLVGVGLAGTAAAASNPVHGLVFGEVVLAEGPFAYVTAETGPLGWVLLGATLVSLLLSVGLLVRAFLAGTDPAWRPVGVLGAGLSLAVVVVALSVLDRGPIPQYDYTGAAVAGLLLTTTGTLFGHGLHRIKQTAQKSLIEDLDDPIVIANDARVVVEYNDAAAALLPGLAVGEPLDSLLGFGVDWPGATESTTVERSRTELLPERPRSPDAAGGPVVATNGGRPVAEPGTSDEDASPESDEDRAAAARRDDAAGEDRIGADAHDGADDRNGGADPEDVADGDGGADHAATDDGDATELAGPDNRATEDEPAAADDRHFLVQTTPVTAATGDSIGYTVRFTDVTELKRRRIELASRNAQLEQVASTISHDLRNPMTVASGYVEQLRVSTPEPDADEPVREPAALAESLEAVRESLVRMSDIIDDILALARSDEPVSPESDVSFTSIVSDAWATVDTDGASLSIAATGSIDADPQRLQRMLENLFRNAVEHAGRDVTVTVGLTQDGFYVADDGEGVPEEAGEDVFEQGYTSAPTGTGLGLSIVSQLARAHGWRVGLDPDADGARFEFTGCETDVAYDKADDPFESKELQ